LIIIIKIKTNQKLIFEKGVDPNFVTNHTPEVKLPCSGQKIISVVVSHNTNSGPNQSRLTYGKETAIKLTNSISSPSARRKFWVREIKTIKWKNMGKIP